MRFIISVVLTSLALAAVPALAQSPAPASATLTAKMAAFNYLFGSPFNCTANVPAMAGQPAHTENSTVSFDAAPNNVMHVHIAGTMFMGDQYFGYSTRANTYWSTSSDSNGSASAETSADGKTYRGTMSIGPMNGTSEDVYTKVDNNHATVRSTATIGGQTATTTVSCSR